MRLLTLSMRHLLLFILLAVGVVSFVKAADFPKQSIRVNGNWIKVEIAQSPEQLEKGLMGRSSLPLHSGMLFIFNKEEHQVMWMKNTQIALDIVFFDSKGNLTEQHSGIVPCYRDPCPIYKSALPARYLLELPAGSVHLYQWEVGKTQLRLR